MKLLLSLFTLLACTTSILAESKPMKDQPASDKPAATQHVTFGGGCFWCMEAVFQRLKGVKSAASGYAGGEVANPTYKQVCTGDTGHAEVVQLEYDPAQVSFETLLKVFWAAHDPTTLNRQGGDVGDNYRSIILTLNDEQKAVAEKSKAAEQKNWPSPIVTQIEPLKTFYIAEVSHQDYYRLNGNKNPYCQAVIRPKMEKLEGKGIIPKR